MRFDIILYKINNLGILVNPSDDIDVKIRREIKYHGATYCLDESKKVMNKYYIKCFSYVIKQFVEKLYENRGGSEKVENINVKLYREDFKVLLSKLVSDVDNPKSIYLATRLEIDKLYDSFNDNCVYILSLE